jgi:hypothetical protein
MTMLAYPMADGSIATLDVPPEVAREVTNADRRDLASDKRFRKNHVLATDLAGKHATGEDLLRTTEWLSESLKNLYRRGQRLAPAGMREIEGPKIPIQHFVGVSIQWQGPEWAEADGPCPACRDVEFPRVEGAVMCLSCCRTSVEARITRPTRAELARLAEPKPREDDGLVGGKAARPRKAKAEPAGLKGGLLGGLGHATVVKPRRKAKARRKTEKAKGASIREALDAIKAR